MKAGLQDDPDGGLSDTLRQWNEIYFHERGLSAHLKLSKSAMKRREQQSIISRRETHWYGSKKEKDRKRAERKFVIVLTRVDDNGRPSQALYKMSAQKETAVMPELLTAFSLLGVHVAIAKGDESFQLLSPSSRANKPVNEKQTYL